MTSPPENQEKIGGYSVGHLVKRATEIVREKTDGSIILDKAAEQRIPKFDSKELELGRVLGRGGFCVVSEVNKITLSEGENSTSNGEKCDDEHYIHNIVQDRTFMQDHCVRSGKNYRYAVKRVQESSRNDVQLFVNAIVDLAVEARFLAVIRHPNIVKMRAMDRAGPFRFDFFLVLDRLYDILPQRIAIWKKQKGGKLKRFFLDRKGKHKLALWVERLNVVYDLSCALNYLHGLHIIYRDLKPDNIGFDVRGDVKIFDFGLARELDPKKKQADGTYKLTGDTGSLRYMAPEVALEKNYNETIDVFSLSILAHQIFSLETPYAGYTLKMFDEKVIKGGRRPSIDPKWGDNICKLLSDSFVDNPSRPTMNAFSKSVREEINKLSDEDIVDIIDASRKSEMSARGVKVG